MNVLIVNTSERTGGAAVAAGRLMQALAGNGVGVRMLVRDRQTDRQQVDSLPRQWLARWRFLWERFVIFLHLRMNRDHLFDIDTGACGTDITSLNAFRQADVVHLHWINQGMLSLGDIRKILKSGKPVVWTMHDLWPATSLCHYARGCRQYASRCRCCPLLPGRSDSDLSARVWKRKAQMLAAGHVSFVACSRWLEGEARRGALLRGHEVVSIPNPIDTRVYHPADKAEARRQLGLSQEGCILLFVSQRVTDERKGVAYLIQAIGQLLEQQPQLSGRLSVALLGGHADEVARQLPLPVHALGYVSDEQTIVSVYNAADAFVTPSLEDNLPNTIMEAMACGVPCVGFRVGGIPEMIDHKKTGYVAECRNSADLARGIGWVIAEADRRELSEQSVRKVARCYSQSSVAVRYIEVYQKAIAQKHFKL